jgi:hypothetical protein
MASDAMIKVETGELLRKIFDLAAAGVGTRMEIASPFFDCEGALWQRMVKASMRGTRVRLFTRWPDEKDKQTVLHTAGSAGVLIAIVPNLHAKAALLTDASTTVCYGWVGSHNLTMSSERTAMELGVAFSGHGPTECELLRDLLGAIGIWERTAGREARRTRR